LIGPHHGAEIFRVERAGEGGRIHQVTKQHGELAAFGLGCLGRDASGCYWETRDVLRYERWRRLSRRRARCWEGLTGTRPDQHAFILISGYLLCIEEFILEIIEGLLIQVKLALECPIRHTLALAQEIDNMIDKGVKVHRVSSARLKVMAHSRGIAS
jgi:hypothetical protein